MTKSLIYFYHIKEKDMKFRKKQSLRKFLNLHIFTILLSILILPTIVFAQSWKWIAYGDTRSSDKQHRAVLQSIMNNTPDYKFMINVGDVISNGTDDSDWATWQKAVDDILGGAGQDQTPPKYMSAPGNHDDCGDSAGLANWHKHLPGQAQQYGNDGIFFVFDYENARFIILDSISSSLTGEQHTKMMDAIENNPQTWLFVFWHKPIFVFGKKNYEGKIHESWGIPLYQNGCDIMFMGHAHHYVRTKKLELNGDKNPPLDANNGTAQIITGNGGVSTNSTNPDADGNGYMVKNYTKNHGYCEFTVDGNVLHLRHILADGTIFDEEYYSPNPKPGSQPVGPPTQIAMISGNDQTAEVGTTLPAPFVVEVRDTNNLPVSGVEVLFNIASGNGALSNSQPRTTGLNGRASTILTLGNIAETITVSASSPGLNGSPLLFLATSVAEKPDTDPPAPPTNVTVVVGSDQGN